MHIWTIKKTYANIEKPNKDYLSSALIFKKGQRPHATARIWDIQDVLDFLDVGPAPHQDGW